MLVASESSLSKDWLKPEEEKNMEEFVKGEVVVIPFPFSDLSEVKRRPAFVVNKLAGDDAILCQITSHTLKDKYSVPLRKADFTKRPTFSQQ